MRHDPADRQRRALDLFEQWYDWPEGERDKRLNEAVAGDPDLAELVARLIQADQASTILPTVPPVPVERGETPAPPSRVGAYALTGVVGQGGMGTVYRGERCDGLFEQVAAVKLLRPGFYTAQTGAQFARERQILARLRHPHIAQLYDGGTTEDGQSYFVMELVDGTPIHQHCEAQGLALPARIVLVRQVCDAVQYAHGQLIVHADIKPGNVLIERQFGAKLLDFGISRLLITDPGDEPGGSGHSPDFASPQQMSGERATPADDLFALGKVIKLLSKCQSSAADEELDAVITQATAEYPAERYPSVEALSGDLDRWLAGKPVTARAPSRLRAANMFVRRNLLAVGAGAAALTLLIGATIVSAVQYSRAEQRFAETRALSNSLLTEIVPASEILPGSGPMRMAIANHALAALEKLSRVPGANRDLQTEVAEGYLRIGEILSAPELRDEQNSGKKGDAALAEAERRFRALSPDQRVSLGLARTLVARELVYGAVKSDGAATRNAYKEAVALLDPVIQSEPGNFAGRLARISAENTFAGMLDNEADFAGSEVTARRVLAMLTEVHPRSYEDRILYAGLVDRAWSLIGDARWYGAEDKAGAELAYAKAFHAYDDDELAHDARAIKRHAHGAFDLASTQFELGKQQQAVVTMQAAIKSIAELRKFDRSVSARHQENTITMEYATELRALGKIAEAETWFNRSIEGRRETARMEPDSYDEVRSLPVGLRVRGQLYRDYGDLAKGCADFREALALWQELDRRKMMSEFDRGSAYAQILSRVAKCE